MIRRRMEKVEAERRKRDPAGQKCLKYMAVPTKEPKCIDISMPTEMRPQTCSVVTRKPIVRDLSSISEECRAEQVRRLSPLGKAFEFCKQLRKFAVHSS